jgi:hypothetical protein
MSKSEKNLEKKILKFVIIKKTRIFIVLKAKHYAKKSKKVDFWAFFEKFENVK